jgi:hypothetical protein
LLDRRSSKRHKARSDTQIDYLAQAPKKSWISTSRICSYEVHVSAIFPGKCMFRSRLVYCRLKLQRIRRTCCFSSILSQARRVPILCLLAYPSYPTEFFFRRHPWPFVHGPAFAMLRFRQCWIKASYTVSNPNRSINSRGAGGANLLQQGSVFQNKAQSSVAYALGTYRWSGGPRSRLLFCFQIIALLDYLAPHIHLKRYDPKGGQSRRLIVDI